MINSIPCVKCGKPISMQGEVEPNVQFWMESGRVKAKHFNCPEKEES